MKLYFYLLVLMMFNGAVLAKEQSYQFAIMEGLGDILSVTEGELMGLYAPMFLCIANESSLNPRWVSLPPARMLHGLQAGHYQFGGPFNKVDKYGDSLLALDVLVRGQQDIYLTSEALKRPVGERIIAARRKSTQRDKALEKGYQVIAIDRFERMIKMLSLGRIDGFVMSTFIMDSYMERFPELAQLKSVPLIDSSGVIYVNGAFAKSNSELVKQMNNAIAICRTRYPHLTVLNSN